MDFGSLRCVTVWRLTRFGGTTCRAIVVYAPEGFRLVLIENQQIVEWTHVPTAAALRAHVKTTFRKLRRAGWRAEVPSGIAAQADTTARRRSADRPGLLRIAEQVTS